jgi:beta-N-acetylhexosaminidase
MAAVFGCAGLSLGKDERAFFRDADPLGFILFARNVKDPDQVSTLCGELRDCVGRADAPILIDQEGGRVARLTPPYWRKAPPPARFAALYRSDARAGLFAAKLNARLLAAELLDLGITVDCAPVLDVPQSDADPIIGDRAAGATPEEATVLGRAACDGFLSGGVLPVIKHMPGHGRATVDSHKKLPVVDAPLKELERIDFVPFRALNDMPWAMTAHVVYTALDPRHPATLSAPTIRALRKTIGFGGVLVSDDLGMHALSGDFADRARGALAAGCDLVLHCSGQLDEMKAVAKGTRKLDAAGAERVARAEAMRQKPAPFSFDPEEGLARLNKLLGEEEPDAS